MQRRQIEVVTKDHGDQPEPENWRCPGCGRPAKVHWRRTLAEHEENELSNSIARVNVALYVREHAKPGDPATAYPASVLSLKQLPDAWKCVL